MTARLWLFFEAPDRNFEFKDQHDFDLHIALEVNDETLERMFEKGRQGGREVRGISDHGFCRSIYFRDPNGYVIELAAPAETADNQDIAAARAAARQSLDDWQTAKR